MTTDRIIKAMERMEARIARLESMERGRSSAPSSSASTAYRSRNSFVRPASYSRQIDTYPVSHTDEGDGSIHYNPDTGTGKGVIRIDGHTVYIYIVRD